MGWHGVKNATPGQQDTIFLAPLEIFVQFFYCCFIFVVNEKSPKIFAEINLVCVTCKKINSFLHVLYTFDCDNVKLEISSQMLYHVILQ